MTTIQELWDFNDPAGTRHRMQDELEAPQCAIADEIHTQIARTYGLESHFQKGHEILDRLQLRIDTLTPKAQARLHLERGRLYRSAGEAPARALKCFKDAQRAALVAENDELLIDAIHMIAIVCPERAIELHEQAIALAKESDQPEAQRWLGSLLNNQGWALHDEGRIEEACAAFEQALAYRQTQHAPKQRILIARWSVAMMWRLLGQTERALAAQQDIAKQRGENESAYNLAEIAKCLVALNQTEEARAYATRAIAHFKTPPWQDQDAIDELEALLP